MLELGKLGRKDLQSLAKQHGIKANLSTTAIIEKLAHILANECLEQQHDFPNAKEINIDHGIEKRESLLEKDTIDIDAPQLTLSAEPGPFSTLLSIDESDPKGRIQNSQRGMEDDIHVGDKVEVLFKNHWVSATVKRVNKVSYRVYVDDFCQETTVKTTEIRMLKICPNDEEIQYEDTKSPISLVVGPIENEVLSPSNLNEAGDNDIEGEIFVDAIEGQEENEHEEEQVMGSPMQESNESDDVILCNEATPIQNYGTEECEVRVNDPVDYDSAIDTYDMANDDDLLLSTLCVPTPTRFKKASDRKSFAAIENKTPKKARTTDLPPWNTSTKGDSEMSIRVSSSNSKPSHVIRRSISTTPAVPLQAIVPKTNATQRLRMEALKKKVEQSSTSKTIIGGKITPSTSRITPMGTKTGVNNENMKAINKSKVAFKEKLLKEKHVSSGEVALKVPSECPTSSTKQINPPKKPTPNFSKMHQKQFNNSKSIASFVERNQDISKKMDDALEAANNGLLKTSQVTFQKMVLHGKEPRSNNVVPRTKNLETNKSSFLSDSNGYNKENAIFVGSFLTNAPARLGTKEVTTNQISTKKFSRREAFVQDSQKKRAESIATKRKIAESSQHNPFHYVA